MTRYEKLIELSKKHKEIAEKETDSKLKVFNISASEGFRIKSEKISVEEAEMWVGNEE